MASSNKTSIQSAGSENPEKKTGADKAAFAVNPHVNAAAIMMACGKTFGEQDINELVEALRQGTQALQGNDLGRCEGILMSQAYALQSLFTHLSRLALKQDYLPHFDHYMRMALKSQNQCRMTLETLATIKNPPVVYAKQANIAHGHQQVNNGSESGSHAEKIQNQSNELLGSGNHEKQRLDSRTKGKAGRTDSAMAAMAPVHRAKKRGG